MPHDPSAQMGHVKIWVLQANYSKIIRLGSLQNMFNHGCNMTHPSGGPQWKWPEMGHLEIWVLQANYSKIICLGSLKNMFDLGCNMTRPSGGPQFTCPVFPTVIQSLSLPWSYAIFNGVTVLWIRELSLNELIVLMSRALHIPNGQFVLYVTIIAHNVPCV